MKTESEPSIFTRIIKREIPADIIYEDKQVIAFFTIEPINYGHTLVVPKKPIVNIFDGDDETLSQMMMVAKKVSRALMDEKFAEGVNIVMNNGVASGQEIFHAHIHVMPMPSTTQGEYLPGVESAKRLQVTADQLQKIATGLKKALI